MKSLALFSALGAASVLHRETSTCCFTLSAVGAINGTVQETTDGLLQIGGSSTQVNACVQGTRFYDSSNKTLGVQSSNLQFTNAPTSTAFTFSDNYNLEHDGVATWYACEADGVYTIGTQDDGCEEINLLAGGFSCAALGASSTGSATATASATSTSASATTTAVAVNASCPSNIAAGTFAAPALVIPISSLDPDVAFGNSYNLIVTPDNTTLINYNIPPTFSGTCALLFEFPWAEDEDANAGGYEFSGIEEEEEEDGGLAFSLLSSAVNESTTFNSQPSVATGFGKVAVYPGNNYTIAQFPCPAGQTATFSIASVGNVVLEGFIDSAPEAFGLYVVPC